jgi:1-acyl-sn-glycerol-3-phosphate acyltransferase
MGMLKKIFHTTINFILYQGARIVFTCSLYPLYRIRVFGGKNIPRKGPVLLLSNHQSFWDPIMCQLPPHRWCYGVARDSLYEGKVLGFLLRHLNTIEIKRGQADIASMRRIINALKSGKCLFLYPEATRSRDGKIIDVKPGFSLLSRKTDAVLIPMVIDGAFDCWPREQKFPNLRGNVGIIYGEPIKREDIKGLPDKDFAKLVTGRLRDLQSEVRKNMGREPYDYSE